MTDIKNCSSCKSKKTNYNTLIFIISGYFLISGLYFTMILLKKLISFF